MLGNAGTLGTGVLVVQGSGTEPAQLINANGDAALVVNYPLSLEGGLFQVQGGFEFTQPTTMTEDTTLSLRHRLHERARVGLDRNPLEDDVVEADEMYQNAGEKGIPHADLDDPPRRRANSRRGHCTFETDRPPIAGVVGREPGEVRLDVIETASMVESDDAVDGGCLGGRRSTPMSGAATTASAGATAGSIEQSIIRGRSGPGRSTRMANGVREVHCNTMEGLWTGVRNFLRPFRGVSKWFLAQYVAVFQCGYNLKEVTNEFMRVLMGISPGTSFPSSATRDSRRARPRCSSGTWIRRGRQGTPGR